MSDGIKGGNGTGGPDGGPPGGVPVVMYHGVGPDKPGWLWNHLITPVEVFEGQMRALHERGWRTITLAELHGHIAAGLALPPRAVVLTFDDGYVDNWSYAYPVLKRYGHHAVIWMSTDFIDGAAGLRPTTEDDRAGRPGADPPPTMGFLSWDEMREMTASGRIEIQSHARTHTWYPCAPEIVDFHRPEGRDGYRTPPWLAWNLDPARKPAYMSLDLERMVPYGTPVYRHAKALERPRYVEDGSLTERLVERVRDRGGASYFDRAGWREELMGIVLEHGTGCGRMETQTEYEERVRGELAGSKRILEEGLGRPVSFLCWPGGGRNPRGLEIAAEVGYLSTTTHFSDPSRRNTYGQNPREINRIDSGSPWVWRGLVIKRTAPGFFIALLERFAGDEKSVWTLRRHKLKYLLGYFLLRRT